MSNINHLGKNILIFFIVNIYFLIHINQIAIQRTNTDKVDIIHNDRANPLFDTYFFSLRLIFIIAVELSAHGY